MKSILLALLLLSPIAARAEENPIIDLTAIDAAVNPCQDFYQFACGSWLKRTTLPSDQSRWTRSFSVLLEQNSENLRNVLVGYSQGKNTPAVPDSQKLGAFYAACMNEDAAETETPNAIRTELQIVNGLKAKENLPTILAQLHLRGVEALFSFGPSADLKDPTFNLADLGEGELGLPNSADYSKTDPRSMRLRSLYVAHITKLMELAGYAADEAAAIASDTLALETALAQNTLPPELQQDPTNTYFPTDLAGLAAQTPHWSWPAFFAASGMPIPSRFNVEEPKYFAGLDQILQFSDVARLRHYLAYRVIESLAPSLGAKLFAENFDFTGRILFGAHEPSPRWKRCVSAASRGLSDAVGQAYVAIAFPPEAKARAEAMIASIRHAFTNDLQSVSWLDNPTRVAALEKLGQMGQKVGYPDHWKSYEGLTLDPTAFWRDTLAIAEFEGHRRYAKIGQSVDPREWHMSAQTVNASYDPSENQINIPAAILQPPFFSIRASDAANYGSIGMVIGHEMTHGFDTSGSQFDGHGLHRDWWTPGVHQTFELKATCLEDQYSRYEALPNLFVNGNLTITENIADEGGLRLSMMAYKLAHEGNPPEPALGGYSPEQQYFLAMAQAWCTQETDEYLRQQVSHDPHSPSKYRVIGTMVNSPDFSSAFQCQAGTPMAPVNRCGLW